MSNFDYTLYFQYQRAMELRESDPDEAIRGLNQLRDEAIERNDHGWRLIAEHWRTQVYINWKKDYITANRLAVETAIEARQDKYKIYQEYICVQNDLLLVYKGIDPVGYAKEIKEAIDLTIGMTTPDISCHYCMNRDLIDYHLHIGEIELAEEQSAKFFAMTENNRHYRIEAYEQLCYFTKQKGEWSDLLQIAQAGAQLAGQAVDESSWITLKCYEMIALQKLGKDEDAEKSYNLIQNKVKTLKMVQGYNYYHLISLYQELQENMPEAVTILQEYIATLENTGRPYWECRAYLELIRLLKLSGKSYENAVAKFKQSAEKLRKPSQFNDQFLDILEL